MKKLNKLLFFLAVLVSLTATSCAALIEILEASSSSNDTEKVDDNKTDSTDPERGKRKR